MKLGDSPPGLHPLNVVTLSSEDGNWLKQLWGRDLRIQISGPICDGESGVRLNCSVRNNRRKRRNWKEEERSTKETECLFDNRELKNGLLEEDPLGFDSGTRYRPSTYLLTYLRTPPGWVTNVETGRVNSEVRSSKTTCPTVYTVGVWVCGVKTGVWNEKKHTMKKKGRTSFPFLKKTTFRG